MSGPKYRLGYWAPECLSFVLNLYNYVSLTSVQFLQLTKPFPFSSFLLTCEVGRTGIFSFNCHCENWVLERGEVVYLKSFRSFGDESVIRFILFQMIGYTRWYLIFLHLQNELILLYSIFFSFFLAFYGHNSLIRLGVSRVLGCLFSTDTLITWILYVALTISWYDLGYFFVYLYIVCVSH